MKATRIIGILLVAVLVGGILPFPVAASSANARWLAFLSRTVTYDSDSIDHMSDLTDALGMYDTYSAAYYAQEVRNESLTYYRWVNAHPAAACYRNVWNLSRKSASDLAISMKYMRRWLNAFPWGSNTDYNRSMTYMKKARTGINRTTAAIAKVVCP